MSEKPSVHNMQENSFIASHRGSTTNLRVLLVGASGTIGSAVADVIQSKGRYQLIRAGLHESSRHDVIVDIGDINSIRMMFENVGNVDYIICAAGVAEFGPIGLFEDAHFERAIQNKLMGQVNLVRVGMNYINSGGHILLTSGSSSQNPAPGASIASMVNGGLEAFVRAAALELPPGMKLNVISPAFVKETMIRMGLDATQAVPADITAYSYYAAMRTDKSGKIFSVAASVQAMMNSGAIDSLISRGQDTNSRMSTSRHSQSPIYGHPLYPTKMDDGTAGTGSTVSGVYVSPSIPSKDRKKKGCLTCC